jgi:dTDP-4-dehydrorhamnose 3,5-epimerase
MNVSKTPLDGVLIVEPRVYRDHRGYFLETYNRKRYGEAGIDQAFVQDNLSYSIRDTLRGMHYQLTKPQAKLVQVTSGRIFDVVIDIRAGSPTFKRWFGVELSGENTMQLFVGHGFAHGFCVLSESALVTYKCTDFYDPADEGGLLWSDPEVGVEWPVSEPLLSPKDADYPGLDRIDPQKLPVFRK